MQWNPQLLLNSLISWFIHFLNLLIIEYQTNDSFRWLDKKLIKTKKGLAKRNAVKSLIKPLLTVTIIFVIISENKTSCSGLQEFLTLIGILCKKHSPTKNYPLIVFPRVKKRIISLASSSPSLAIYSLIIKLQSSKNLEPNKIEIPINKATKKIMSIDCSPIFWNQKRKGLTLSKKETWIPDPLRGKGAKG